MNKLEGTIPIQLTEMTNLQSL